MAKIVMGIDLCCQEVGRWPEGAEEGGLNMVSIIGVCRSTPSGLKFRLYGRE